MRHYLLIAMLTQTLVSTEFADEDATNAALAKQAGRILRQNCYRCHKGQGSESGYAFNVIDLESLVSEGMVVAEDHENSEVYNAMFRGRMPPRNRPQLPRPSPEDVDVIKRWIAAGAAEIPKPEPRPEVTLKDRLTAIRNHLQSTDRDD